MAWTQTDLDELDAALKAKVRRVKYSDGREVEYDSMKEMLELRNTMTNAVGKSSGRTMATYATFDKD